jgi:class 3 adenylate cyclase/tetratricopeptide (TPR) repeat protein
MRCSKCGANNREGRKFCAKCAAPVACLCPQCGASNEPGEDFCGECAAPLGSPPAPLPKRASSAPIQIADTPAPENFEGERKTITALFADIKGSMDLIETLDPEEARAIVDPALKLMMDAAHRYGGYVAQSTGDGIFAMFGAPVAHEDHPQRALWAASRMQDEMQRYSAKLREAGHPPLEARVGVNTGEVVMRSLPTEEGGHTEYVPVGHSISLAARMEVLAPVGSIATTQEVRSLCEGYFLFKSLGPTRVKGVSDPVNVYEVTGPGPLRTHFQLSTHRGLTQFVGRGTEMEAMARAAELAKAGHGQLVCVVAEPGVGKSRLFHEFKARNQRGWMVLEAFSVSHGEASAYLPVIDLLHSYFRIAPEDDTRTRREKVSGRVLTLDRKLEDALPYLLGLLGLTEGDDPLARMDARIRRQRTLKALKRILLRESLNQPLIVIFEDLHWIDEETQAFLNLLADSIGTAKLLLLMTHRPEYSHSWGSKTYYTQLRLDPLGKESASEMFDALLGVNTQTIDAALLALKHLIVEKTEGTPLFMEEVYQALIEEGALIRNGVVKLARPLNALKIPTTVQAILASRIDRLPAAEKQLLHTVAAIGTEFSLRIAAQVVGESEDELASMLSNLQQREFVYERLAGGDIEYVFKHALTLEVAYNSILIEKRKLLHERTAQAIESLFAKRLDDHADQLAHHYVLSDNTWKAVKYLHLAGRRALERSTPAQALNNMRSSLELLRTLSETPDRDRQEIVLQTELGFALGWAQGLAAPEVERAFTRALALCEKLGENAQSFALLNGLRLVFLIRLDPRRSREFAERALSVAQRADDRSTLLAAFTGLGITLMWLGDFGSAHEHLERGFESPDPPAKHGLMDSVHHPRVACVIRLATTSWFLGYPDRARRRSDEAIELARESAPADLGYALVWAAQLSRFLRDFPQTLRQASDARSVMIELGSPLYLAWADFLFASTITAGPAHEETTRMEQAASSVQETGGAVNTWMLLWLAEGYGASGRADLGLDTVTRALELSVKNGERWCEAELYRLKGELQLIKDADSWIEAEQCFRTAIGVALEQRAKSLELRASTSLARLLAKQGKRAEARTLLADIYNWFTEGFDTADLKDAKALLDELSG